MDDLDLSHVPKVLSGYFRNMLRKHSPMRDGSLGEIRTAEQRIELVPWTRPIAEVLRIAWPKAREIEELEVQKMLKSRVIESTQSEWASLEMLFPRPDRSTRFCIDYRRFYGVMVKDTNPIRRIDGYIYSPGTEFFFRTRLQQRLLESSDRTRRKR